MLERAMLTSMTEGMLVVLTTLIMYLGIIAYARIAGLRSFSKMSAFDYVTTLAFGSIMASTIVTATTPTLHGLLAVVSLGTFQALVAMMRRYWRVRQLVDTPALLLMRGPHMLHENLSRSGVTEADLRQKLREANVLSYADVRAVVFETTGDVTVMHSSRPEDDIEPELLTGIRGVEQDAPSRNARFSHTTG